MYVNTNHVHTTDLIEPLLIISSSSCSGFNCVLIVSQPHPLICIPPYLIVKAEQTVIIQIHN